MPEPLPVIDEEPRAERCDSCRFWERCETGDQVRAEVESGINLSYTEGSEELGIGECRRYPPRVCDEQTRRILAAPLYVRERYIRLPIGVVSAASLFPCTAEYEWCGEWQARPEQEKT